MSNTITIHHYTGTWDDTMRPTAPNIGSEVMLPVNETPDRREMDGFIRVLGRVGCTLMYDRTDEKSGMDVWTVERDPHYDDGSWTWE